jgi:hypothetical protein
MKFGHNLPRNQVPEWAASYINYKGLKKLIKTAADASKDGSPPDLAGKHRQSQIACRAASNRILHAPYHTTSIRNALSPPNLEHSCLGRSTIPQNIADCASQNSFSPSIETSKTSITSIIRNMRNAPADCACYTVAMDELRSRQRASTRTRYKT